jgi:hypothetical protein
MMELVDAMLAAWQGDRDRFYRRLAAHRDTARHHLEASYHTAQCLAYLGDRDEALDWLGYAAFRGLVNWRWLSELDPFFAPLRGDPHFEAVLADCKRRQADFIALHGERGAQGDAV